MADMIAVIGLRGFPNVQGGVEKHCEALYPRIPERHFHIYRRKPYIKSTGDATYSNITFHDFPSTKIRGVEAVLHTFLSTLSVINSKCKLVHVHNIGPGLFIPILKLFGKKVVMTYHSPNYEHKKWGRFARWLLRAGENISLRHSDKIIFVNAKQREKFVGRHPGKTLYIPNGVNHNMPSLATDFINSLGVAPGSYILGVGRLTPEKGFEYLVKAVNKLDKDIKLIIAGGSDNNDSYFRKLKSLDIKGRVIFTGNVFGENLRQLYSHAKLFVLSSVNEGFPLVLLEAMDYQLPVLSSDIPGAHLPLIPETNFFSPGDSVSITAALNQFLSSDSATRTDYDLSPYNWDNIARQTETVYREVLGI